MKTHTYVFKYKEERGNIFMNTVIIKNLVDRVWQPGLCSRVNRRSNSSFGWRWKMPKCFHTTCCMLLRCYLSENECMFVWRPMHVVAGVHGGQRHQNTPERELQGGTSCLKSVLRIKPLHVLCQSSMPYLHSFPHLDINFVPFGNAGTKHGTCLIARQVFFHWVISL